jgi:hypothetical protein
MDTASACLSLDGHVLPLAESPNAADVETNGGQLTSGVPAASHAG